MVKVLLDMDFPRECHECPLQLKFKDGEMDDWYSRRCVLMERIIEYPRPNWCPLKPIDVDEQKRFTAQDVYSTLIVHGQSDLQFQLGETIKYSPSDVKKILLDEI